jgi:beta-lactamase superfamily II metal-dependent hydrolase
MNKLASKLIALLFILAAAVSARAAGTLDIYWIDVEGGASTLIVTPAHESILVDTGWPASTPGQEGKSAARIHAVAVAAGLSKIDHLIVTHFHIDHFGGAADLAKLIPIGEVLDNGIPDHDSDGVTNNDRRFATSIQPYRDFPAERRSVIQPGQAIALKQSSDTAPLSFTCLGARQKFIAPSTTSSNAVCSESVTHPTDTTDNANSIVMLLKFGPFRFFDGGDLTWNTEAKLVCPYNIPGTVDLFQVDHHGMNLSNNPLLVKSLNPTVAIIDNGPHKGGMPQTLVTLRGVPSIQTIYQLHRNILGGAEFNTDSQDIANLPQQCEGNYIKCSVDSTGKSYTITVPATGLTKTYATVLNRP